MKRTWTHKDVERVIGLYEAGYSNASIKALLTGKELAKEENTSKGPAFQYLEIRACVEHDGEVQSFLGEPTYHEHIGDNVFTPEGAKKEAEEFVEGHGGEIFWTLYGRLMDGTAQAIGDFTTFEATLETLNAILAPMAAARDIIEESWPDRFTMCRAACDLDDFINQCSTDDRL